MKPVIASSREDTVKAYISIVGGETDIAKLQKKCFSYYLEVGRENGFDKMYDKRREISWKLL